MAGSCATSGAADRLTTLWLRGSRRRVLSLALVPFLIVTLTMSVLVPALEMRSVTRLLGEIHAMVGPVDGISHRLEQVAAHERQSVYVNAVLVIVALGAIATVVSISTRERRLAAALERRVEEEAAMGRMGRRLSEAVTLEDAAHGILEGTVAVLRSVGAYMEVAAPGAGHQQFSVVTGGEQSFQVRVEELAPSDLATITLDHNGIPYELPDVQRHLGPGVANSGIHCSGLVLPLLVSGKTIGTLVLLRDVRACHFSETERSQLRLIGDLAIAVIRRIHVERQAFLEIEERREELERLMKSRQRLMRGFSHDVKNPLGAADGYADLLSAGIYGELADEQVETVQRIRRSIRRALDLIDDLHELARVETGAVALRKEPVDLADLVARSGDEYRGAAHAAGLPLTVDADDDLPMVQSDGARILQIVSNLISNAIKYTRSGSVKIRVRREPSRCVAAGTSSVAIDVTDTGLGIPVDKQQQIFEEFSRLTTSDRPGAGLGLAISKRLAEALGGQILVTSEVGRGSTFTLRLPTTSLPSGSTQLTPETQVRALLEG